MKHRIPIIALSLLMTSCLRAEPTTQPATQAAKGQQPSEASNAPVVSGGEPATEKVGEVRRFAGEGFYTVAFLPGGDRAIAGSGKYIYLWDIKTGKEVRRFGEHELRIAVSPNGRLVASCQVNVGNGNDTVKLWNLETGRELRRFKGHEFNVSCVAFSPDGRYVGSGSSGRGNVGKKIRLWEVKTGKELRRFDGHTSDISSVAFSADGRRILSGSGDQTVRLWDIKTGKELRQFRGHTDKVTSVAFSPDGRQALSGSWDKTLRLWDVSTGKELRRFEGHTARVSGVAFSPDGRRALSGSYDKTVRLWNVATDKELHRFEGHNGWVMSVAFSPDGRYALSGSWDGTVRLWRLPAETTTKPTTKPVVQEYVRRIKMALPKGWSVETEKDTVMVSRKKPVEIDHRAEPCMLHDFRDGLRPMNKAEEKAHLKAKGFVSSRVYSIKIRFAPPMSKAEVARLVLENKKTSEKYYRKHPVPASKGPRKPLAPPAELTDALHPIPDILNDKCSMFLYLPMQWYAFYDKADETECRKVEQAVLKILKSNKVKNRTTQPTTQPTTTSAPAVDPAVMAILKRLEAAGEKYPNITADIDFKVDMLQTGDSEERAGKVYYQGPGEKAPAKFRIHFDTLRQGTGPRIKDVVDYAFDGAWLTVRKERIKQMSRYQVARPGEKVNPLQLGKGPFPVPFGQKADTVIKHFRATTRPAKKTAPKDTDYIKLTTRRRYRKDFSVVWLEMWISRKTSLPVKIVAEDRSENQTTVIFKDTKTPKSFDKKIFTLPRPPAGWEYHVERFKK